MGILTLLCLKLSSLCSSKFCKLWSIFPKIDQKNCYLVDNYIVISGQKFQLIVRGGFCSNKELLDNGYRWSAMECGRACIDISIVFVYGRTGRCFCDRKSKDGLCVGSKVTKSVRYNTYSFGKLFNIYCKVQLGSGGFWVSI